MKISGIIIILLSLINTSIIAFAYRDFSIFLVIMFLISAIGLPLGSYLTARNSVKADIADDQEIEVAGLFTLGSPHQNK